MGVFSRNTSIVVGAGASFELGLPLGDDLRDNIAQLLNITFPDGWNQGTGSRKICNVLRRISLEDNIDFNILLQKCWLLRDALPGSISIDNLLDAHRNDRHISSIGKLAIAEAILQAERKSSLFNKPEQSGTFRLQDLSGTWLIPLLQMLTEGVPKEESEYIFSNVSFIVFNCDRCLEEFLPKALSLYYGHDENHSNQLIRNARIIHPYGRVGELGEGDSLKTVAFGSQRYDLHKIARGIRTFTEGLRYNEHADEIKHIISRSDQVIFLGFAFHPINMDILSVSRENAIQKIFGTTIKLSDAAVRSVTGAICQAFSKRPPNDRGGRMPLKK